MFCGNKDAKTQSLVKEFTGGSIKATFYMVFVKLWGFLEQKFPLGKGRCMWGKQDGSGSIQTVFPRRETLFGS